MRMLLVARKVCAHIHYFWYVDEMSSSRNVELVISSVLKRKKWGVSLYMYTFVEKLA